MLADKFHIYTKNSFNKKTTVVQAESFSLYYHFILQFEFGLCYFANMEYSAENPIVSAFEIPKCIVLIQLLVISSFSSSAV